MDVCVHELSEYIYFSVYMHGASLSTYSYSRFVHTSGGTGFWSALDWRWEEMIRQHFKHASKSLCVNLLCDRVTKSNAHISHGVATAPLYVYSKAGAFTHIIICRCRHLVTLKCNCRLDYLLWLAGVCACAASWCDREEETTKVKTCVEFSS